MPEDVVDDGFTISARQIDPDVVLVEIVGDLDMQTVPQAQRSSLTSPRSRPATSSSTCPG
jgi:hypothetical protein